MFTIEGMSFCLLVDVFPFTFPLGSDGPRTCLCSGLDSSSVLGFVSRTNSIFCLVGVGFSGCISGGKNYEIRLVAQAKKLLNGKIAAFVFPQFVKHDDHLSFVKNEYNGVVIESSFADKQFFYGKGAGSFPTASAVLSDISALRYDYKYEYKKLYHHKPNQLTNDFYVRAYISFDEWNFIPREKFEWIEEWHGNGRQRR